MSNALDLFCGAGGATRGYQRAGFKVTGIDLKHGKRYVGDDYIRGNVMDYLNVDFLRRFDFIHASPPCQSFSITKNLRIAQGKSLKETGGDLMDPVRDALIASGVPYVIENVVQAPLINPLILCGSMFGLAVRRHRGFESSMPLSLPAECDHKGQGRPVGIYGGMRDNIPSGGRTAHTMEEANAAMGIDWMIWGELCESIPPAYTEWIGTQILDRKFV